MRSLIDHSGQMKITLHRAFDMCVNPFHTLELAKSLGIHAILTSGCQPSCLEGIDLIRQLDEKAEGRIAIMAGRYPGKQRKDPEGTDKDHLFSYVRQKNPGKRNAIPQS